MIDQGVCGEANGRLPAWSLAIFVSAPNVFSTDYGQCVKGPNKPAPLRHSCEEACEEVEQRYKYSSFPRKRESIAAFPKRKSGRYGGRSLPDSRFRACKKIGQFTNTRHSRESGNLLRRFRKKNRADIADGRRRIPAFAGMTKYYSAVIVFYNADTSANRPSQREARDFFPHSFARMTKGNYPINSFVRRFARWRERAQTTSVSVSK